MKGFLFTYEKPITILDDIEWRKEWQDMPEFKLQNLTAIRSIKINFASQEDIDEFAKLIKQTITNKTKSLWYPKAEILVDIDKIYIDKNES
mgnify:FL=1